MPIKKLTIFLITAILAGGLVYYFSKLSIQNYYTVETGPIRSFLSASGELDANKKAELSFKTTGRIAAVNIKENQSVRKGEVVASLDKDDLKAAELDTFYKYIAADANAKEVEDSVKGHDKDESYTQKNKRVAAQTARDIAYDNWLIAQRAVKNASLYAPFDSKATLVDLEVNEWVSAFSQSPQVILIDPTTIYFSAEINPDDIASVKVGQKADVIFDSYPDTIFKGEAEEIASATSHSEDDGDVVKVKLKLTDLPEALIIGLSGDAQITLEEKNAVLLLPRAALFKKESKNFVKTTTGEKQVVLGIFDGVNWEVREGLQKGEVVLW